MKGYLSWWLLSTSQGFLAAFAAGATADPTYLASQSCVCLTQSITDSEEGPHRLNDPSVPKAPDSASKQASLRE